MVRQKASLLNPTRLHLDRPHRYECGEHASRQDANKMGNAREIQRREKRMALSGQLSVWDRIHKVRQTKDKASCLVARTLNLHTRASNRKVAYPGAPTHLPTHLVRIATSLRLPTPCLLANSQRLAFVDDGALLCRVPAVSVGCISSLFTTNAVATLSLPLGVPAVWIRRSRSSSPPKPALSQLVLALPACGGGKLAGRAPVETPPSESASGERRRAFSRASFSEGRFT